MIHPHYDLFGRLFTYPTPELPPLVAELRAAIDARCPEAAAELTCFADLLGTTGLLAGRELDDLQEVFTRSFEVQSIATLDVGYVAFGDDYKRGELLVNLNRELRDVGLDGGVELSDHLSNVLRLIARWEDEDAVAELVAMVLHPSLEKMVREFATERMVSREALYKKHYKTLIESPERVTMYRHALRALLEVVRWDFELVENPAPETTSDFLSSLTRELEMEARGEGHRTVGRTS